ncbi:Undecaprenyl-phosphate 4-deoxy-4-formamido-L-arabinose transferase [uncultured Clostridium sp.]|uniref:glycosyltransferase family 2 protein n=1 Tax=uncultured Clostridium sp. TaxID=59620 RepID=UPI000821C1E2|nr:glycosyltransferase family A protein [uncultured Clostridium sp.]SCJ37124.1 Undecaprenyl-phosphate 4-deoxy-4-formamido-L-arabinose transferase [uncultured Clostridium sp.]
MKISIIVPVYNAENFIDKLIKSVLCQKYNNYELILVDDGSTDNSYNIIKNYSENNSQIHIYKKENSGPGLTRKYGFQKCSGDLLFFIDSDDWITDEKVLMKINKCFSENDIDVLFFDREDIVGDKRETIRGFDYIKPGKYKISEINDVIRPGLGAKILKKSILKDEMFIESKIFEDLYTTYMYLDVCEKCMYVNETFYTIYHDNNSNSLSSRINDKTFEKSLDIILMLYYKISNDSLKGTLSLRMANIFATYSIKSITNMNRNIEKKIFNIVKILNDRKVKIRPRNNKLIKRVYYDLMLRVYLRRIANEDKK